MCSLKSLSALSATVPSESPGGAVSLSATSAAGATLMTYREDATEQRCRRLSSPGVMGGLLSGSLPALLLVLSGLCGLCVGTELSFVTCGSVVKLLNLKHNVRLHSHDVRYGSGSGQQSVTGVTTVEDSNSYWSVRGTGDAFCHRGTPVKCGQTVRLTHVNTGRNLHSHYFTSPLSSNQEVSAFGEEGEGDHLDEWTVQCGGSVWKREEAVRFRHKATEALLSVTGEQYGRPIHGQREVHAMAGPTQHSLWKAMEGIFMKPSESPAGSREYSHLHTEF